MTDKGLRVFLKEEVTLKKKGIELTYTDQTTSNLCRASFCMKCGGKLIQIRQKGCNALFVCSTCAKGYLAKLVLLELTGKDLNPILRYMTKGEVKKE